MAKTKTNDGVLEKLVEENKVKRILYERQTFIVRSFNK